MEVVSENTELKIQIAKLEKEVKEIEQFKHQKEIEILNIKHEKETTILRLENINEKIEEQE